MTPYILPTLFVSFALNGFLAGIVITRGLRRLVNLLYAVISLAVAAWILMLLGYFAGLTVNFNWLAGTHLSAITIAFAFYLFSGLFPRRLAKGKAALVLPAALYGVIVDLLVSGPYIVGPSHGIAYEIRAGYLYYALAMLFFFVMGYCNLVRQYRADNNREEKYQILFVLTGFFLASALAMVTDLIFPYLGIFSLTWLGPVFTIILVVSIFIAIVRYRLFSIRIIATEAFVFLLWAFELIRTLAAVGLKDELLNAGVFGATIVIGGFLIRGVRKEVEQREWIESLAARLRSVNRILSHDVKGALGKNRDMFSLLLDGTFGPLPDKLTPLLQLAYGDTRKTIAAITTILEAGAEIQLNLAPCDFKAAVLEVVNDVKPDADKKGLALITKIDDEADFTILADRVQLATHVLHNLIENAVNYTPQGSVEVGLAKKDGATVLLSVRDSGVGISPEDKAKLFTEGGRGTDSLKVNPHSTGYGLFIALRIAQAHGGRIWAESAGVGQGATFFVELPAGSRPSESAIAGPASPESRPTAAPPV